MTLCKFFNTVFLIVTWAFSSRMFSNMSIICLTPVHASFCEGGCVGKYVIPYFKHFSSTTNAMFLQGSYKKHSFLWAFFLPSPFFSVFFPVSSLSPFFSIFSFLFLSLLFSSVPLFSSTFFLSPIFLHSPFSFILLFSLCFSATFSPLSPLSTRTINSTMVSASVSVVELLQLFWIWSVLMHIFLPVNENSVALDPLVLCGLLMIWDEGALGSFFLICQCGSEAFCRSDSNE